MSSPVPDTRRRRLYTLLATGNNWLTANAAGWDDGVYRQILRECGATERDGRISATTMTVPQLEQALEALKRAGFKPRATRQSMARAKGPLIDKITALWCALADAGVVRDRSDKAMRAFMCKFTASARLEWARPAELVAAVEALKSWADRTGVPTEPPPGGHAA